MWQLQVASELLSKQAHAELLKVGDSWLATQLSTSEDELAVPIAAATTYARFIGERVEISDLTVVPAEKIDAVWREWRTAHTQI